MKGSFAKTDLCFSYFPKSCFFNQNWCWAVLISCLFFINHVFFYCALKGISIKLVLVYSFYTFICFIMQIRLTLRLFPRWCPVIYPIGHSKIVTYFAKLQKLKKLHKNTLFNRFQTNQINAALCNEQINSEMGMV